MKKLLSILTILFIPCAFASAQSFMDVRKFNNTFEINIVQGKQTESRRQMAKCQAVRLNKEWFVTAAHCLKPICDNECTIRARLMVKADYELVLETHHASMSDGVFKLHEREGVSKNTVGYDIALIHFKPEKSAYRYVDNKYAGIPMTKEMFLDRVKFNQTEYNEALEGTNFPTFLLLKAETPKLLNRSLAVASIWDGQVEILASNSPVFYSPKNQYLYTGNFGIRQGISGSGVVTSSGELVGVVSSVGSFDKTVNSSVLEGDYVPVNLTFLAVFDEYAINFIRRNIGQIQYKNSDMQTLRVIPAPNRDLALSIESSVT